MADSKRITLPKGTLVYPALQRPDTKFASEGAYKADVKLPKDEAKPFIDRIQAIVKAHTGKVAKIGSKNCFFKNELNDDGEPTGFVIFSIRVKNRIGKDGKLWDRRPALIGANKLPIDVNPWGGTVARVQVEVYEWQHNGEKGVSLQPLVVQIIDLVTGKGSEPQLDDFDEEDGYSDNSGSTSDFSDESSTDEDDDGSADY